MRDLNQYELESWYSRRQWPCCGGTEYLPGPRGAMAMNITCPRCGTVMNVLDPTDERFNGVMWYGQMIKQPPRYQTPKPPLFLRILRHFAGWKA